MLQSNKLRTTGTNRKFWLEKGLMGMGRFEPRHTTTLSESEDRWTIRSFMSKLMGEHLYRISRSSFKIQKS